MKLRYTRTAALQLDRILAHIKLRSPQGAARVLHRVDQVERLLRQFPGSGRMTSIPGIRRIPLVPYPYVIDYQCIADEIIILRVRHTSRKPVNS